MTHRIERGDGWELHACDWRDADLPTVDMVCEDPPYGERTHGGQRHARNQGGGNLLSTNGIQYDHWTPDDVLAATRAAAAVCPAWIVTMTSHDLIPAWEAACADVGRYSFAPIPIVIPGMNVRLAGDGPSNWTVYMLASRTTAKINWGTKPGAYYFTSMDREIRKQIAGTKPLGLMETVIGDYSARGDLVLDRFAGSGTTGLAAIRNGRRFIGYERKPEHYEIALKRLRAIREQRSLFQEAST